MLRRHRQQQQQQQLCYCSVWTPHKPPGLPSTHQPTFPPCSDQSHCQEPCCLHADQHTFFPPICSQITPTPLLCDTVVETLLVRKLKCMLQTGLKPSPHRFYSRTKESKKTTPSHPIMILISCVAAFVERRVYAAWVLCCVQ